MVAGHDKYLITVQVFYNLERLTEPTNYEYIARLLLPIN